LCVPFEGFFAIHTSVPNYVAIFSEIFGRRRILSIAMTVRSPLLLVRVA